jgi:hypothetical protein
MLAHDRRIVREESRYWWVLLVSGIAWVLIAWIVLRLNQTSITTVGVLIGVVFIVAGANEVTVATLVPGGWKVWHYVMAFIFFLGGLWGLIEPVETFFALASVLGLILIIYGTFEIARAVAPLPEPLLVGGLDHGDPAALAGLLGVRVRSCLRARPEHVPHPVLGGLLRVVQGHHADRARVRRPSRGQGGGGRFRDGVGDSLPDAPMSGQPAGRRRRGR